MALELEIDVTEGDVKPISVPVTAVDQLIINGPCRLVGWSLRETTGAATAVVEFQDGGDPIAESEMASAGTDSHAFRGNGVKIMSNIFLHVVSGSVTGAVYVLYDN